MISHVTATDGTVSNWPGHTANVTDDGQVWVCDEGGVIVYTFHSDEWTKVEIENE